MIEERSLGVKAPGGSKEEHPCRGTKREGVAKYAMKRNIFNESIEIVKIPHLCIVTCRALGSYAPATSSCRTVALRKKKIVDRPESYNATHSKNCIFIAQKKLRTIWT